MTSREKGGLEFQYEKKKIAQKFARSLPRYTFSAELIKEHLSRRTIEQVPDQIRNLQMGENLNSVMNPLKVDVYSVSYSSKGLIPTRPWQIAECSSE